MKHILSDLGIHAGNAAAGFFGGVVRALVLRQSDPWGIIGSVVVGTLTAGYFGEWAADYLPVKDGAAAFLVGLGGMAFCQGAMEQLKKWRPPIGPSKGRN